MLISSFSSCVFLSQAVGTICKVMVLFWEMLLPLLTVWLQCFQIAAVSSQPLMSLWFLNRAENTLWWELGGKCCWPHSGPFIHINTTVSIRTPTILAIKNKYYPCQCMLIICDNFFWRFLPLGMGNFKQFVQHIPEMNIIDYMLLSPDSKSFFWKAYLCTSFSLPTYLHISK